MIPIAVCDDEKAVLDRTRELLQQYDKAPLQVDIFTSGEELVQSGKSYEIIFLDIDMKGMNGFETAKEIRKRDKQVKLIYVTNYSDYTIFAFEVHAFAYLLKPLKREELYEQLQEALSYGEKKEEELEFVTKEGIIRRKPSQLLFFEYVGREVVLHAEKQTFHMREKIGDIQTRMESYDFVMPHKSFVINLYHVFKIDGTEIVMADGSRIPLSQKKAAWFRRVLNRYLASEKGSGR